MWAVPLAWVFPWVLQFLPPSKHECRSISSQYLWLKYWLRVWSWSPGTAPWLHTVYVTNTVLLIEANVSLTLACIQRCQHSGTGCDTHAFATPPICHAAKSKRFWIVNPPERTSSPRCRKRAKYEQYIGNIFWTFFRIFQNKSSEGSSAWHGFLF